MRRFWILVPAALAIMALVLGCGGSDEAETAQNEPVATEAKSDQAAEETHANTDGSSCADCIAQAFDPPDDLVTENEREPRLVEVSVPDVQIGPAHPAGPHPDQHLTGTRLGPGSLETPQRSAGTLEDHRPHPAGLSLSSLPVSFSFSWACGTFRRTVAPPSP